MTNVEATNTISMQLMADLMLLEGDLKGLMLWSKTAPAESAFLSQQPFCLDSMSFHTWLQFVFIPKMRALIEHQQALPACCIAPMAEQVFGADSVNRGVVKRNEPEIKNRNEKVLTLIARLEKIDHLLSSSNRS